MYKNICIFNELCDGNNIGISSLFYLCGRILKGIFSCPEKLRMVYTSEKHQTCSCRKMSGGRLEQRWDITSDFDKANPPYLTTVAQIRWQPNYFRQQK